MKKLIILLLGVLFISNASADSWLSYGNYDIKWYNKDKKEFDINTNQELAGLCYLVNNMKINFKDKVININDNINLSDNEWIPIGYETYFQGTVNGHNHSIYGIHITGSSITSKYYGFWAYMQNATISDLILSGRMKIYKDSSYPKIWIGGFAGYTNNCKIEHCDNEIDIYFERTNSNSFNYYTYLGGFVGDSSNGGFSFCKNKGYIEYAHTGDAYYAQSEASVGGIVGDGDSKIECCENSANIVFENKSSRNAYKYYVYAGGIAGSSYDHDILYCKNSGNISVTAGGRNPEYIYIGCIAGMVGYCKMIDCFSYGDGLYTAGGIPYFSGIAYTKSVELTSCYTPSDIIFSASNSGYSGNDGIKSFSKKDMQTKAFLDELNVYPFIELGKEIWTAKGNDYPYVDYYLYTGNENGISEVPFSESDEPIAIYNIQGQRIPKYNKGINIIKYKNNRIRKMYLK